MAMTDYFQVLTPERWKYLCHYETTETENGGYKLTYYNEDVPVLTLEARYYDGEDQPLDSVWQGYLGRIETVDGKKYDLLSTISQYSKDASDEWKEMYDTYLDVINGIRIMDGCSPDRRKPCLIPCDSQYLHKRSCRLCFFTVLQLLCVIIVSQLYLLLSILRKSDQKSLHQKCVSCAFFPSAKIINGDKIDVQVKHIGVFLQNILV